MRSLVGLWALETHSKFLNFYFFGRFSFYWLKPKPQEVLQEWGERVFGKKFTQH